jgi:hypothetical protein
MLHKIFYSFPVQLLLHHCRHNLILLAVWALLLAAVTQNFGNEFGVPYLFLAPAYLNEVDFFSLFFMGMATGGITMSYHITCYVLDCYRFNFLGALKNPFSKFCLNNSPLPLVFILVYLFNFINYQTHYQFHTFWELCTEVLGFVLGLLSMFLLVFVYFQYTNKDIFQTIATKVDKQLKKNAFSRLFAIQRMQNVHTLRLPVKYYIDFPFVFRKAFYNFPYNRTAIAQVFDQNQLNAVTIQLLVGLTFILLGWFRDVAYLQLPAAALIMIALALLMTIVGFFSYWLRTWAIPVVLLLLFLSNEYFNRQIKTPYHQAFGMNYSTKSIYNLHSLQTLSSDENYLKDTAYTKRILTNWKAKFEKKQQPKMIFVCTSGGGMRAAVWTMHCLKALDSATKGKLFKQTMLITGASGGMLGAAYYRELYLNKYKISEEEIKKLAKDKLNTLIYSLIVNDLTLRMQEFTLGDKTYPKDRGYAFERQWNWDTDFMMDKPIIAYQKPEFESKIPMLLLTPTIVNDSRKLYISSQPVSYLTTGSLQDKRNISQKIKGIEFRRLFARQEADSLRFLTALRMNATFPYITPNVILPSEPAMEVMDAGLIDNFGVSDALRFLYVFRHWIAQHTSGVIFICIRDPQKEKEIAPHYQRPLFMEIISPIATVVGNLSSRQDIQNDNLVEYAKGWFAKDVSMVDFQYQQDNELTMQMKKVAKASLSWRLTQKELDGIGLMLDAPVNKKAMKEVQNLVK